MGAAASIGATPEERAANNELLMKELAGEYEALRQSGKSDAEIAAQLEEAIKNKAPMLFARTTDVVPSPLKSRLFVDYDMKTGHKVVTQLDEVVPTPPPQVDTTAQAVSKPATTGSIPGTPVGGAPSAEVDKVLQGSARTMAVLQHRTSHHFLVAIDGSDTSHQAYLTALRLRKGTDVLELFHFYDPHKVSELSPHLKPERIKERYEVDLVSRLPKERYGLSWLEKGDLTTRNLVVHYCNQQAHIQDPSGPRVSFLVLGYTGRRGPEEAPQLMGSVVDLTLRAAHVPTLIVKKALPEIDQPRVFVVAVDEAERCWNAYLTTLLLTRPKDKVTVLHLYDDTGVVLDGLAQMSSPADRSTLLGTRYERDMAERGLVGASFVSLPQPRGTPLHTTILDYSLEHDSDFIVLAPRPQEKLCSVAEHLVQKGRANVLVVKN